MNNNIDKEDLVSLYKAFTKLCDHVETTQGGCGDCPHGIVCFGLSGDKFALSLEKIRTELGMDLK